MFARGIQATGSWDFETCCGVSGNECHRSGGGEYCHHDACCIDNTAVSDFIFRLSGQPQVFRSAGSKACWNCDDNTEYQMGLSPTSWPQWGHFDLMISDCGMSGNCGGPGNGGFCLQGGAFAGYENDVCGGDSNWGHTDIEVWYPVGGK